MSSVKEKISTSLDFRQSKSYFGIDEDRGVLRLGGMECGSLFMSQSSNFTPMLKLPFRRASISNCQAYWVAPGEMERKVP